MKTNNGINLLDWKLKTQDEERKLRKISIRFVFFRDEEMEETFISQSISHHQLKTEFLSGKSSRDDDDHQRRRKSSRWFRETTSLTTKRDTREIYCLPIILTLELRDDMVWRLLLWLRLLRRLLRNWGCDFWSIFDYVVKVRSRCLKNVSSLIIAWMINWGRTIALQMVMRNALTLSRRSRDGYRKMS